MAMIYDTLLVHDRPRVLRCGRARTVLLDGEVGFWALRRQGIQSMVRSPVGQGTEIQVVWPAPEGW